MEFIGSPNVFAGRVERLGDGEVDVAIPGVAVVRARHAGSGLAMGATAAVLVRPERVRLSATPPAAPGRPAPGTDREDRRPRLHLALLRPPGRRARSARVRLNGVEGEAMDRFDEGQKVYLWWDEQDARAFAAGTDTQTAGTPANGPSVTRRARA